MLRVHLDTDIGGDTDDLCALAMLLGSPEVELVGVTTVTDTEGRRLGFVHHALDLAGRTGVPIASGAFGFLDVPQRAEPQDARYWPGLQQLPASTPGDALDLLYANAQSGATVIGIGPLTNLAVLETLRPGAFKNANVVIMGGNLGEPPETGLPQYGPEVDYNIQTDRRAAMIVFERVNPLIVPLPVTLKVCLRRSDLPALEAGGPLAKLLALQAELHCTDHQMDRLGTINAAVPTDILNFQYDSLACAAALGWDCLTVEKIPLTAGMRDGCVVLNRDLFGPPKRVITNVDAERFSARWLETVCPL